MTVETKKINIAAVKLDPRTQVRMSVNDERVELYADNMKDGEAFPPIVVFQVEGEYVLSSGYHRLYAAKKNGYASIEAEVHTGSMDDAILYSLGANARHGLSLSKEEIRRGIRIILQHPEWKEMSQSQIAKHINTSQMTVSRIKAEMREEGFEFDEGRKKFIKGGKEMAMETKRIGKQKKEKPPTIEIPIDKQDEISELSNTISDLEQENRRLRDVVAVGSWEASEIEKEDAEQLIKELREQIRVLEIDNAALRESRDTYQNENAELMKTVKSLQAKIKKLENGA